MSDASNARTVPIGSHNGRLSTLKIHVSGVSCSMNPHLKQSDKQASVPRYPVVQTGTVPALCRADAVPPSRRAPARAAQKKNSRLGPIPQQPTGLEPPHHQRRERQVTCRHDTNIPEYGRPQQRAPARARIATALSKSRMAPNAASKVIPGGSECGRSTMPGAWPPLRLPAAQSS